MSQIYSVWDYQKRRYNYFKAALVPGTHADPPRGLGDALSPVGGTPESEGWRLPANARPAGSGALALGRIASAHSGGTPGRSGSGARADGLGFGDWESRDGLVIAMFVVAVGIAWKVLK